MPVNKYGGLSTDITLGGVSPSDEVVSSQKALKTYIDNHSGSSLPSQAGNAGKFLTTDGADAGWATIYAMQIIDYTGA